MAAEKEKIVIVGLPNVGKSILFNRLDDIYSTVANYPHTTIKAIRSHIKVGHTEYELIDCPGIESLYSQAETAIETRDVLIKEKPKAIIQCLDAANIRRSLLLTAQLMELNIPLLLSLNIIDETSKRGIWINSEKLQSVLNVPVVETIATEDKGLNELLKRLEHILNNWVIAARGPEYRRIIEDGICTIGYCFADVPPPKGILLLLLNNDENIKKWVKEEYGSGILNDIEKVIKNIKRETPKNLSNIILFDRSGWVEKKLEDIIKTAKVSTGSISEKIGWIARHPVWGWPVLIVVLYITYLLVARLAAGNIVGFLERHVFFPFNALLGGAIKSEFLRELLVGNYGIISLGFNNAVGTALPILLMFFLILNILEDSGYFSNFCVLTYRLTKKLGLSGKSVLPMLLAFGCKTIGVVTTKMLESKKEKYIAIFLISFAIPCAPQIGLLLAALGMYSFTALLTVLGILAVMQFSAGIMLNNILKDDVASDFIFEIPAIRLPNARNVIDKLFYRTVSFLRELTLFFMAAAALLFTLDKTGGLNLIRKTLSPVIVIFLSLPLQSVEAFLLAFVKRDAAALILLKLVEKNVFSSIQLVVAAIVLTSFIPCFPNIIAVVRRLGIKKGIIMLFIIFCSAILTAGAVNWILRLFFV